MHRSRLPGRSLTPISGWSKGGCRVLPMLLALGAAGCGPEPTVAPTSTAPPPSSGSTASQIIASFEGTLRWRTVPDDGSYVFSGSAPAHARLQALPDGRLQLVLPDPATDFDLFWMRSSWTASVDGQDGLQLREPTAPPLSMFCGRPHLQATGDGIMTLTHVQFHVAGTGESDCVDVDYGHIRFEADFASQ